MERAVNMDRPWRELRDEFRQKSDLQKMDYRSLIFRKEAKGSAERTEAAWDTCLALGSSTQMDYYSSGY